MKTDRELLELAARAAGIAVEWKEWGRFDWRDGLPTVLDVVWNPLTDDGDALRLAAKLKIDLEWDHDDETVEAYIREGEGHFYCPCFNAADYRRAIVAVAARHQEAKEKQG